MDNSLLFFFSLFSFPSLCLFKSPPRESFSPLLSTLSFMFFFSSHSDKYMIVQPPSIRYPHLPSTSPYHQIDKSTDSHFGHARHYSSLIGFADFSVVRCGDARAMHRDASAARSATTLIDRCTKCGHKSFFVVRGPLCDDTMRKKADNGIVQTCRLADTSRRSLHSWEMFFPFANWIFHRFLRTHVLIICVTMFDSIFNPYD